MIPDRNVSQVCTGYGSPVVFIQLPNSTISIVTVFSPHPPNKTGIPGSDRSPPLKIRSSLESSELMSDTYPVRPLGKSNLWIRQRIFSHTQGIYSYLVHAFLTNIPEIPLCIRLFGGEGKFEYKDSAGPEHRGQRLEQRP
jgi:hypothetical protein